MFPFSKIVVTGGAGFLGRAVVNKLKKNRGTTVFVPRRTEYDLTEKADIVRLLKETAPDLIVHLAATVGGIGYNQQNPASIFYENLMMGAQLIEQARLFAVQKFVALGTVCAYPESTPVPFREEDLWNGYPEETNAPYGLAKKMMLVQSQSYREQYDFNSIFLLPANLYGPGDNFDLASSHVIPALIRKCVEARANNREFVEVWGTGAASREFLYVEDAAKAILRAAALYNDSQPINIGSGQEITIRDLATMIARITEFRGEIRWNAAKPDGQLRRRLDTSKALEAFGFRATTALADGLRKTYEWYCEQAVARTDAAETF